jgi:hypothetical protein
MQERALAGYRVLDLTDEQGWLCGKVLTNLDADVSNVGPPAGDPGCQSDPGYSQTADAETSVAWSIRHAYLCRLCLDLNHSLHIDLILDPLLPVMTLYSPASFARDFQGVAKVCMANGPVACIALPQAAWYTGAHAAQWLGSTPSRHQRTGCCGTDDDRYAAA